MNGWHFKWLYDGKCPFCLREVRWLQVIVDSARILAPIYSFTANSIHDARGGSEATLERLCFAAYRLWKSLAFRGNSAVLTTRPSQCVFESRPAVKKNESGVSGTIIKPKSFLCLALVWSGVLFGIPFRQIVILQRSRHFASARVVDMVLR